MCEGFGYFDDVLDLDEVGELPGIKPGMYQTVMFKPLCGLFNQPKYLPLRFMPIGLYLELADNDAPIITDFNHVYITKTTSTSWKLENCQSKCDILSLENSLDNSYVNHLLGGNTLKHVYETYISSPQTITSADTQFNVSRSFIALHAVFLSLDETFTEGRVRWHNKSWNTFYSTMTGNRSYATNFNDSDTELQNLQLIIGPKLFPETGLRSHAECFYNLRKALGVQANKPSCIRY